MSSADEPGRDDDRAERRYDDDDRSRPKSSGTGLTVGLIVGAIVVILLCVCGGGALFLLPAVQKVRSAASRSKDQNNLKQLGLAMHSESDVSGRGLCGPYAQDQRGQILKGLSFRVGLLPYMEQDNLYRQYDLTQPWDEGRNKAMSDTMVVTYTTPIGNQPVTNQTPYRVFVGREALFSEDGKPRAFADITDGTANTLMVVHAVDRVPWAQPKEFPYSPNAALPALTQPEIDGTNVLFADGSVRFMRSSTPPSVIHGMITRNGAEVVNLE